MSTQPQPLVPAAVAHGPSTHLAEVLPLPAERHGIWTGSHQARFLRELAASHCVAGAARAVGLSRQSAYKLRSRLKGEPFDIAWRCAFRRQYDALAEAALERALHGTEVPHFHKGELVHTSRRFDERLTVALLALRQRLAPLPPAPFSWCEDYSADDFEALVERVEHGDELWGEIEYVDEDEDESGEGEGGEGGEGGEDAQAGA